MIATVARGYGPRWPPPRGHRAAADAAGPPRHPSRRHRPPAAGCGRQALTASDTSCVTTIAVKPFSCQTAPIRSCISIRVSASSAPSGSSSASRSRMTDERARQRDTLLLPAGQHGGPAFSRPARPTCGKARRRLPRRAGRSAVRARPTATLRIDALPGQQTRLLEHQPYRCHASPFGRAVDRDAAAARRVQPRDQPQQRRLAATAAADDGDELPRLDRQVDAAQHLVIAELPVHAVQLDEGAGRCCRAVQCRATRSRTSIVMAQAFA